MKHKLLLTILAIFALSCTAFAQATVTFDATADVPSSGGSDEGEQTVTKDGITLTISNGVMNGLQYRCYKNQTLTVSSTVGNITGIEVTCTANGTAKYGPGCFTAASGTYTYSEKIGTWSGDAAEIVFTASTAQVRMTQVVVTYTSGGVVKKSAGLAFSPTSIQVEQGAEFTAPTFSKETTAEVTFSSDSTEVATVDSEGNIKLAGGLGTAVITASSEENEDYNAGSATCTITVYTNNVYAKTTTVTNGKEYLIVAQRNDSTMYAYPLNESYKYGYLSASVIKELTDTIKVKSTYDDAFTFTAVDGGYTIQDCYGRYLYQSGTYNSFNVGTDSYTWTVEPQDDGTFKIAMNGYYVQWGIETYKTFGVYTEAQDNAVMPMLYQLVDIPTGIDTIEQDNAASDDRVYNLAGQRVGKSYKGIVIKNGKKYVQK